ncbi:transposase [Xenorhabdus bovienii]|nr:transposase [Xenorhabdus bovienii]MDE1484466.1 transposase [Xenorhabdus bovienii]MDE9432821.1 transposase [Xenorhabdus bovienii]MDE9443676.1 transposase [Xenorhabdus bovienii]MDE9490597.1 transposase [Xenorhabdus bovienii]MDE9507288.1 transposase [Xenorhabdus bovienii]
MVHAESLVAHSPASDFIIADKGYYSNVFRIYLEKQGAKTIIHYQKNNRKSDKNIDDVLYDYRYLVENEFARIKFF